MDTAPEVLARATGQEHTRTGIQGGKEDVEPRVGRNCWVTWPRYVCLFEELPDALSTHVHSSVSLNRPKWEQAGSPSAAERVNRLWCIHTVEHPSATKGTKH